MFLDTFSYAQTNPIYSPTPPVNDVNKLNELNARIVDLKPQSASNCFGFNSNPEPFQLGGVGLHSGLVSQSDCSIPGAVGQGVKTPPYGSNDVSGNVGIGGGGGAWDLCKVCSSYASGVHFGVLTCEGCKVSQVVLFNLSFKSFPFVQQPPTPVRFASPSYRARAIT